MVYPKITIAAGMDQIHHKWQAMVAKEQHFFADEGLKDVDIITTNHNDDNLGLALRAGKVQFGLDARPQDILRWVTKEGADIFIIGGYKSQFHMAVMGAKGLKSVKDLRGKKIGVSTGKSDKRVSLDAAQARIMVKSVGLDPDKDVIWMSGIPFHPVLGDPIGQLKKGEADAVFIPDVEVDKYVAEGFPVLFRFKEFYSGGYPDRVVITTGSIIKQSPVMVTAFLKATIRSYRFLRDMPKNFEYLVDMDKRMRAVETNPRERNADLKLNILDFANTPNPPDGRLPVKGFESILAQEKETGRIPPSFTMDKVTRLEFVEQANRELDKRPELKDELERVKQWVKKFGY